MAFVRPHTFDFAIDHSFEFGRLLEREFNDAKALEAFERELDQQEGDPVFGSVIDAADRFAEWTLWWMVCLDCGKHVLSVQPAACDGNFFECSGCGARRMVRTAPGE